MLSFFSTPQIFIARSGCKFLNCKLSWLGKWHERRMLRSTNHKQCIETSSAGIYFFFLGCNWKLERSVNWKIFVAIDVIEIFPPHRIEMNFLNDFEVDCAFWRTSIAKPANSEWQTTVKENCMLRSKCSGLDFWYDLQKVFTARYTRNNRRENNCNYRLKVQQRWVEFKVRKCPVYKNNSINDSTMRRILPALK